MMIVDLVQYMQTGTYVYVYSISGFLSFQGYQKSSFVFIYCIPHDTLLISEVSSYRYQQPPTTINWSKCQKCYFLGKVPIIDCPCLYSTVSVLYVLKIALLALVSFFIGFQGLSYVLYLILRVSRSLKPCINFDYE